MITIKIEHLHVSVLGPGQDQVLALLNSIKQDTKEIKVTDAEVLAVLNQVDATTTKTASNLDSISAAQATEAGVIQTISDELDALVANQGSNGISDATAAVLTGIANRLQTSSDNSDKIVAATQAQIPTLQAIAAKGAPTVPPPPPPPPLP